MTDTQQDRFELFDPLEAINFEDPQDETDYVEFVPPIVEPGEQAADETPQIPATERIEAVLRGMPGEQKMLLHIIDFCREPKTGKEVMDEVASFRDGAVSIYEPETVCSILENAGAIEMLYDGNPDAEPETFLEDGVEYLKIESEPVFSYIATEDGLNIAEENNPEQRFLQVLNEDDHTLVPLFRRVLERCDGTGLPKKQIDEFIDSDPLVQEPRRFSGFFIDKLEEADALRFKDGLWTTTQTGRDMLATTGALAPAEKE